MGIRPFRRSGIRTELDSLEDKTLIHNYGYGGSGLTLAFGGASKVIELLKRQASPAKTVAVLGAGVVGLAVAYDLLQEGYTVHLYADAWSPHLTSNVAAGIWTPLLYPLDLTTEEKELSEYSLA